MTRINLVPPPILTDKHLSGEFYELPRVLTNIEKHLERNESLSDVNIPDTYTLGTGHMKFFYDKGQWLLDRYVALICELERRGTNIDQVKTSAVMSRFWELPREYMKDYEPTPEEIYINMQRLCDSYFGVSYDQTS